MVAKHPTHRRRKKPYLTDNEELGHEFRKYYLLGLRRLLRQGKLRIGGSVEFLNDDGQREAYLAKLEAIDWNVFIQGPPKGKSDPTDVVKYLAGYLTGGPISDKRIIQADNDEVRFWARPKRADGSRQRRGMSRPRPHRLTARQFMQRWTLHVLPKGFTRSRCYGGYHSSKRAEYRRRCGELLNNRHESADEPLTPPPPFDQPPDQPKRHCPHCEGELRLVSSAPRPSWREVFERHIYGVKDLYHPLHHLGTPRPPPTAQLHSALT